MKIFDAHVHVFPDKIAKKATDSTGAYYGIKMYTVGTFDNIKKELSSGKVNKCLIHSTATRASQVESVNSYIASLVHSDPDLVGFGSMHKDYPDVNAETERIQKLGLLGIKLHTDFQGFPIDDEGAFPIYEAAKGKMPILFHVGDKKSDLSHPKRLERVLDMYPDLTVIAAHLGGYSVWKEALCLAGRPGNLYLDASSALEFLPPEEAKAIILRHGTDRVLFGSDFPMHDPANTARLLLNLNLKDSDFEKIFHENAEKLFGVKC